MDGGKRAPLGDLLAGYRRSLLREAGPNEEITYAQDQGGVAAAGCRAVETPDFGVPGAGAYGGAGVFGAGEACRLGLAAARWLGRRGAGAASVSGGTDGAKTCPPAAGLAGDPPGTEAARRDAVAAVGRVPRHPSRRLRLQPLLRALLPMEGELVADVGPKARFAATRQVHVAGDKMFVDYAGQTIDVLDGLTGEVRTVQLFVALLGASSYTYAGATWTQSLPDWTGSHVRAFNFFGGATAQVVSDNLKSGITKAYFHEPAINRTYADLARHYDTAVVPARPYKPRDKAKVEVADQIAERWILAALRNRRFFSLGELNAAIRELLDKLNNRVTRHLGASRREFVREAGSAGAESLAERTL